MLCLATRLQATLEEYQEMPIEDFGVGMLRSMGWDGGAIGGQNKGLVEPVMFVPRYAPSKPPRSLGPPSCAVGRFLQRP